MHLTHTSFRIKLIPMYTCQPGENKQMSYIKMIIQYSDEILQQNNTYIETNFSDNDSDTSYSDLPELISNDSEDDLSYDEILQQNNTYIETNFSDNDSDTSYSDLPELISNDSEDELSSNDSEDIS